ncbi:UBP50 hydrolase, partial [Rhinopomastus cyanomelas]|nr:UBP50 hydrolase [Rhinopomastus cyanomelas]
ESATAFALLMSAMWLGESDSVSPEVFQSVLETRYPNFSKSTQQDAQEFLTCVLNELHDALKKVRAQLQCKRLQTSAKESKWIASEPSIITQLFEGQLSYSITCLECKTTINRPECFTVLSLPVPSKRVCSWPGRLLLCSCCFLLRDCLKCFFKKDELTRTNQIHCSSCETKQDAVVEGIITKTPEIIIFHLKRFESQDECRRKLSTRITYPLSNLSLSPYSSPHLRNHSEYSLCAVVNHSGLLDYGHYTAFCKHSFTGTWYSFNDAQITKMTKSSVQTESAYLLFY